MSNVRRSKGEKYNIKGIAFWNSQFVGLKKNQHENKNICLNESNKTTRDVLSWHVIMSLLL